MEDLIRRSDGEWFDLSPDLYDSTPRPSSMPSRDVGGRGDDRIEVGEVEVNFSSKDPGIQVPFEGVIPNAVVAEVPANLTATTAQE